MINVRLEASNGDTVVSGVLDNERVSQASYLIYKDKHYRYLGVSGGMLHFRECLDNPWDVTEEFK